jgi:hypothetical protein
MSDLAKRILGKSGQVAIIAIGRLAKKSGGDMPTPEQVRDEMVALGYKWLRVESVSNLMTKLKQDGHIKGERRVKVKEYRPEVLA